MHVAHHFYPPKVVAASVIAAVLAVLITLAVVTGLNNASSSSAAANGQSRPMVHTSQRLVAPTLGGRTLPPSAVTDPFSPLLGSPITPPQSLARGG
jgi:hypothetical protein